MGVFSLPSGSTVVGVFPHPDDEAYSVGGTFARLASEGADVRVVCMTQGEGGMDLRKSASSTGGLGQVRVAELNASCEVMGLPAPVVLGFPDRELASLGADVLQNAIDQQLARLAPDVVVTLGDDGVYGHRDHIACTRAVTAALKRSTTDVRLLHCAFGRDVFAPVRRALLKWGGGRILDPEVSGPLGIDASEATERVDIREFRDHKLRALTAHASQLKQGDPFTFLGGGLVDQLLEEEWFVEQSVGADEALL